MINKFVWFSLFTIINISLSAQSTLSGNFRLNTDFYVRDTAINTVGKNYDYNKSSANVWFQTNYSNPEWGLEASIRFDGNYNSMLQNPGSLANFYTIGNWRIKKKLDDLEVSAGYLYEQYGSGIALRTYEDRNMGIDNALLGVKAKYSISQNHNVRAIVGTQKYQKDDDIALFKSFVKGINYEGSHSFNDSFSINFGASVVNRTLTDEDRTSVNGTISNYGILDKPAVYFAQPYNAIVFHQYFTVNWNRFSLFNEIAYKTKEATFNPYIEKFFDQAGLSRLTTLSYAAPGLGITLQNRQIEHFAFRSLSNPIDNNISLTNHRRLSYIAPINKQHSLRLPARLQIQPDEIGEFGTSLDITKKISKNVSATLNLCMIDTIGFQDPYYKEIYADVEFKKFIFSKLHQQFGIQHVFYNQQRYINKGVNNVQAYTFFSESTFKLDRKKSVRMELQYQHAVKELGQSVFALLEFSIAPRWSFSVSDLYNLIPNPKYEVVTQYQKSHHFYSAFVSYTKGTSRFTLNYTKQLEGVVCTGGVCRIEPAFSGLRAQLTSSF